MEEEAAVGSIHHILRTAFKELYEPPDNGKRDDEVLGESPDLEAIQTSPTTEESIVDSPAEHENSTLELPATEKEKVETQHSDDDQDNRHGEKVQEESGALQAGETVDALETQNKDSIVESMAGKGRHHDDPVLLTSEDKDKIATRQVMVSRLGGVRTTYP